MGFRHAKGIFVEENIKKINAQNVLKNNVVDDNKVEIVIEDQQTENETGHETKNALVELPKEDDTKKDIIEDINDIVEENKQEKPKNKKPVPKTKSKTKK